ncbi:hypothetical protein HYC85_001990 [Camellia sinensis]|uniref:Uncharacterized protein n=1 Tax=Camellia sinensis TaxID=4442 RepID=A0A7J7I876_CAMSI|nr:hypothetical protein HYC85_001990 [Camellia sinensis]
MNPTPWKVGFCWLYCIFVSLEGTNDHASSCREFLVVDLVFEVLGLKLLLQFFLVASRHSMDSAHKFFFRFHFLLSDSLAKFCHSVVSPLKWVSSTNPLVKLSLLLIEWPNSILVFFSHSEHYKFSTSIFHHFCFVPNLCLLVASVIENFLNVIKTFTGGLNCRQDHCIKLLKSLRIDSNISRGDIVAEDCQL